MGPFGEAPAGIAAPFEPTGYCDDVMPAETYHADPCERPSLSASLAHVLVTATPAHARAAHPRLNPNYQRDDDPKYDRGTVAHALLLQGREIVQVVGATDWRTNAAKEEREATREAGRIPLLAKDWAGVRMMVEAVQEELAELIPRPFADGLPEQTLVWEDSGVTCRARLDWLDDDHHRIFDLKTTSRSANPETWSRTLFGMGAHIQHQFYRRGVQAVFGTRPSFTFVVCETDPPYAVSRVTLAPDAEVLADAQIIGALATWRRCLETDKWPAYRSDIAYANAPAWEMTRWLDREEAA